jgi:hypothetical protein
MSSRKPVKDAPDNIVRLGARPRVQLIIFGLLLVPVVIAFSHRHDLSRALLSCLVPLLLTGTFRTAAVRGDRFVTRFHVAFIPVVTERCNLRSITSVNAKFAWDSPESGRSSCSDHPSLCLVGFLNSSSRPSAALIRFT